jgi:hypothetical protein
MEHYYVVTDKYDPGSEHDTWEEAADYLRDLRRQGLDGYILGPGLNFEPDMEGFRYSEVESWRP